MLKPAILYKAQIDNNYSKLMYDLDYQYYFAWHGTEIPRVDDNNYNNHSFVSVDDKDNVIGIFFYNINRCNNACDNLSIMSFDKGNIIFIRDVLQGIDDIFNKYNFNRIQFACISDNPAIKGYRKFIHRIGGKEFGYAREVVMLLDGKLHDSVYFEVLKKEYKKLNSYLLKNDSKKSKKNKIGF